MSSSSTVVREGWMIRYGQNKIGIHIRYFVLMLYVLYIYNREKNNCFEMEAIDIQEFKIWKEKRKMIIDQQRAGATPADSSRAFSPSQQIASLENQRSRREDEEEEEDNQPALLRRTTIGNVMDDQENEYVALERILMDASMEPVKLSYAFLQNITNDFSQAIGSGGFGVVYMGVIRNWKVAVKKLFQTGDFSDKHFEDELTCLRRVKHKNIMRFLGYCSDTQQKAVQYNGQFVLAEDRRRFLCFEYVPNKSLHEYLKDESHGREWGACYQLIEAICQGLRYLHNKERISHLDLKPENILLDDDMVPKISDFGLSRRFSGEQSRIITENVRGSRGYIAPEYWSKGEISLKSDIFSLGIIIRKLLWGSKDLSDFENWHESLDIQCPQVKKCIKIAQLCVDDDQCKRPTIDCIIDMLSEDTGIQMASQVIDHSGNNSGSSEEQMQVSCDSMQMLGINSGEIS